MKRIAGLLAVALLTGCTAQYAPAREPAQPAPPAASSSQSAESVAPTPVPGPTTTIQNAGQPDYTPAPTPAPTADSSDSPSAPEAGDLAVRSLRLFGDTGWMQTAEKLYHTADGGKTWTDVSPGLSPLMSVQYVSGQDAWLASSGTLVHTKDGGKTWLTNKAPFVYGVISFVGAKGYAMVPGDPGAGNMPVTIYATLDNGGGWSLLAGSLPTGGIKTGMAFADADHGWVTATYYAPGKPWVYATRDAGSSWQKLQLPVDQALRDSQFTVEAPIVLSGKEIVLPAQAFTDAGLTTVFYTSNDGGINWDVTSPMAGRGAYAWAPGGHGWFFDGKGLEATADGGRTWSPVKTRPALSDVTAISFASATEGVAVNHGALLRTTDGGVTWTPAAVR